MNRRNRLSIRRTNERNTLSSFGNSKLPFTTSSQRKNRNTNGILSRREDHININVSEISKVKESYWLTKEIPVKDRAVEYKPAVFDDIKPSKAVHTEKHIVKKVEVTKGPVASSTTNEVITEKTVVKETKTSYENKPIKLKGTKVSGLPIDKDAIVKIKNLRLSYKQDDSYELKDVIRGSSIYIKKGETFALIGESGSGKSVITSTIFGLQGDAAVVKSGKVIVKGQEVQDFSQKQWEKSKLRGSVVSAVFQNPMTTLNPTMKIGNQITEGILLNKRASTKKEAMKMAIDILHKIRIPEPEKVVKMYPHQLSGGMKQRIVIAAIVSCQPEIIVMDEPTTALDPSVQADVLKIVKDLQKEFNLTIVFITHDLGVVSSIADRIAIMYAGQIVEVGTKKEIMWKSAHPYTWGLLQSMPDVNKGNELSTIKGSVPNNLNKIKGDAFAPRNDYAMGIDFEKEPPYFKLSNTHFVKSWLYDAKAPKITLPKIINDRRKGGK